MSSCIVMVGNAEFKFFLKPSQDAKAPSKNSLPIDKLKTNTWTYIHIRVYILERWTFGGCGFWCKKASPLPILEFRLLQQLTEEYTIFWDMKLCSLVDIYWRFRGTYCFHLLGRRLSWASNIYAAVTRFLVETLNSGYTQFITNYGDGSSLYFYKELRWYINLTDNILYKYDKWWIKTRIQNARLW
jgi:hypothetical protein